MRASTFYLLYSNYWNTTTSFSIIITVNISVCILLTPTCHGQAQSVILGRKALKAVIFHFP